MHIPDELLVHILNNLDYRALLICTQVCKIFKDTIDCTAALQYTIELAVSGQRDNGRDDSKDCSKEKLDMLKKHQEVWKELKWSREINIPISNGGLWELYGGVLAQNTEGGDIQFCQLPSDLRGIEEKRWTLPGDFGFTFRDFSMDPGQDLLVLVQTPDAPENDGSSQYRVHFYTMSTGKPHPLAPRSMVAIPQTRYDPHVSYSIQVFGDFVGVHFCPDNDDAEIALWNWKTGELQIHICAEGLAFTQLSDRWMLVAYSDQYGQPRLNVVDFVQEPSRRCAIDQLETSFELEYPPLSHSGVFLADIQLRADPGCFVDSRPGGPFSQDTKDFIIVFTTNLVIRGRDRHVIQFISAQRLLALVEKNASILREGDGIPVPYTEWVNDTRMRLVGGAAEPSDVWVCYVSGNRYTLGMPTSRGTYSGFEVEVMDFNQLALKRDAHLSTGSDYSGDIKTQPSQIPMNKPFSGEVETCLPYRRQTLFLEGGRRHCEAMCTEDAIVVVDQYCMEFRVLVF